MVLFKKIMDWLDHHCKIWNKPTDEVNNSHKGLNLFLGSRSRKVKDNNDYLRISTYSRIRDNMSKELALGNTKNGLGRI
jgi:hypothetical protein